MSKQVQLHTLTMDRLKGAKMAPAGHIYKDRNEVSSWMKILGMVRGVNTSHAFERMDGAPYQRYRCNSCSGVTRIKYGKGDKQPGTVHSITECICPPQKNPPPTSSLAFAAPDVKECRKCLVRYFFWDVGVPITDMKTCEPVGWKGNVEKSPTLFKSNRHFPLKATSDGKKRRKIGWRKHCFLRLPDGRWFQVRLQEALVNPEDPMSDVVWTALEIPDPRKAATIPSAECLPGVIVVDERETVGQAGAAAAQLDKKPAASVRNDLEGKSNIDICIVCHSAPSTTRLICERVNKTTSPCAGSKVCSSCVSQLCLRRRHESTESTNIFWKIPVGRRSLQCLSNCADSHVTHFALLNSEGEKLPLMFPAGYLHERPFVAIADIVDAQWAFDTFVWPIFKSLKKTKEDIALCEQRLDYFSDQLHGVSYPMFSPAELRKSIRDNEAELMGLRVKENLHKYPKWATDWKMREEIPVPKANRNEEEARLAAEYYSAFDLGSTPDGPNSADITVPAAECRGPLWRFLNSRNLLKKRGTFWSRYGPVVVGGHIEQENIREIQPGLSISEDDPNDPDYVLSPCSDDE